MSDKLPDTVPCPLRHPDVSEKAKWLAGEGAGSWFEISKGKSEKEFEVKRLAPNGIIECQSVFSTKEQLDLDLPFTLDFPSNCMKVSVVQEHQRITLIRIKKQTI